MTSFYFVRHGKSQANQDGTIADNDSPLSKEGEAQARKVGRDLKKRGIKVVATSPLPRAKRTAEIIAKELKIGHVEVINDLRERGLGLFQGRPKEQKSDWYFSVEGESDVEPRGVVIARCEAALQAIKKLAGQGPVLVVGHAISGYYLQQVAAGKRLFEQFDQPPKELRNGQVNKVAIMDKIPLKAFSRQGVVAFGAIVLGLASLIAGIVLLITPAGPMPEQKVNQQVIPMSANDFKDDPHLQGAIQKQLQEQSNSNQSDSGVSNVLQPNQGIPKP